MREWYSGLPLAARKRYTTPTTCCCCSTAANSRRTGSRPVLAATVNCTFVTGENCAVIVGRSPARVHHGGETTWMERCDARVEHEMLLKHYREQGLTKAELSRRFGVSRRTIHYWIESGQMDRDLATGQTRYSPRPAVASMLDPYAGPLAAAAEVQHPDLGTGSAPASERGATAADRAARSVRREVPGGGELMTKTEEMLDVYGRMREQEARREGRQEGREQGRLEGQIGAVENLLRAGAPWPLIESATGIDHRDRPSRTARAQAAARGRFHHDRTDRGICQRRRRHRVAQRGRADPPDRRRAQPPDAQRDGVRGGRRMTSADQSTSPYASSKALAA